MDPMQRIVTVRSGQGAALRGIEEPLRALGASITFKSDTELIARAGSRARLRLLGVYLKSGRDNLPWKVVADAVPGAENTANVVISSDEGFMVARVPRLNTEYDKLLDHVARQLTQQ